MAWCRPGDKPLSEPMMVHWTMIYASLCINELALRRCSCIFKSTIFKLISRIDILIIFSEIAPSECHNTSLIISQDWFRSCLGAIRQQANSWDNVYPALRCHTSEEFQPKFWYFPLTKCIENVVWKWQSFCFSLNVLPGFRYNAFSRFSCYSKIHLWHTDETTITLWTVVP